MLSCSPLQLLFCIVVMHRASKPQHLLAMVSFKSPLATLQPEICSPGQCHDKLVNIYIQGRIAFYPLISKIFVKILFFLKYQMNVQHRYAEKRQLEEFLKSEHTCGVCFMEYPGSQFHRLEECRHHFCHECMMEYCSMHVKEGTVQFLR